MHDPTRLSDARGASRLVTDLALLVTDVVETMHHNILRIPWPLGTPTFDSTRGIPGLVYRSVRGVTRLVGDGVDAGLASFAPFARAGPPSARRDAVVAALNGVLGDRLEESGNPLAIPLHLRHAGRPLALTAAEIAAAFPQPSTGVVVMVHGLCMSDGHWRRGAHDLGRMLARDLGVDVVYVRYNSGRHVATNGAELAVALEHLVHCWPRPLERLILVGHSMGGLVMRSACVQARRVAHAWTARLRGMVFLGTPHHGAPLERAGQGLDLLLGASPYTAAFTRLGRLRSAGITDLRHGTIVDQDRHRDRFHHRGDSRTRQPLPAGVPCFAVAGSLARTRPRKGLGRGDGLVPIASALGQHPTPGMDLHIPPARQCVAYGCGHLELLGSRVVYRQLRNWLSVEKEPLASSATRRPCGRRGPSPAAS